MEKKRDGRCDVVMTDVEGLVPADHLVRKIEAVMDYEWLYERLRPYYCEDNGRPGIDPVVLIKMALLEHLYGIPSLRQTHRKIEVNVAYRWFLGYSLLEKIPYFATASYAFCRRFPPELSEEIFAQSRHYAPAIFTTLSYIRTSKRNSRKAVPLLFLWGGLPKWSGFGYGYC